MVTITFSSAIRTLAKGAHQIDLPDFHGTLDDLLNKLAERYGTTFSERLRKEGTLRPYVNVFVNGNDVRFLQGLATPLPSTATVDFIPAVAGG